MKYEIFQECYARFDISEEEIMRYAQTIYDYEKYIDKDIAVSSINDIEAYMKHLVAINENKYNNVVHFARYYYYIDKKDEYIHMTKYFNSIGVLENIVDRIARYDSEESKNEFIKHFELPPFGTNSDDLPQYTLDFMDRIQKHLSPSKCRKILAGNNHQLPKESQLKEKALYNQSSSLKSYLKDRHERKVAELQEHLDNNKVWFEQIITKEAVEYVKSNQEILSGVIENDKLYVTKIPYDINNFLQTEDDKLKRYYACHCSFVRENIKADKLDIPKEWCYCSAGFAKFPYEVILEQEFHVELLKTPLDGDYVCRFEIDLSNANYKK